MVKLCFSINIHIKVAYQSSVSKNIGWKQMEFVRKRMWISRSMEIEFKSIFSINKSLKMSVRLSNECKTGIHEMLLEIFGPSLQSPYVYRSFCQNCLLTLKRTQNQTQMFYERDNPKCTTTKLTTEWSRTR